MTDLVAFLTARLDEDEQLALRVKADLDQTGAQLHYDVRETNGDTTTITRLGIYDPARVLRDVEAKRLLVSDADDECSGWRLKVLALPYADHPDYDESWKP